tara:strand:- start:377 stop:553 length:177 start_codon:yes stop_codon:yes gene_type:complete
MVASVRNIPATNGGNLERRTKAAITSIRESTDLQNLFSSLGSRSKDLSSNIKIAAPIM